MNQADDGERLIQEVLTELGWDADAKTVAEQVRRLCPPSAPMAQI